MSRIILFALLLTAPTLSAFTQDSRPTNSAAALDKQANALCKAGRYSTALVLYQRAARMGDASAELSIGTMYRDGKGVARDANQSLTWLERSANQNYAPALLELGNSYINGDIVTRNFDKAFTFYMRAANLGYAPAQFRVGLSFYYGDGVPRSAESTLTWFQKAAAQNDPDAQRWLGLLYRDGNLVPKNIPIARSYLQNAANAGHPFAQAELNEMNASSIASTQQPNTIQNPAPQDTCAAVYIVVGNDSTYGQHFYYGAAWSRSTYADALAGAKSELLKRATPDEVDPRQLPDAGGRYATAPEQGSGCAYAHGAVAGKLKIAAGGCSMYNSGCAAGTSTMGAGIYDIITAGFANTTNDAISSAISSCRTSNGGGDNEHETCTVLRQW